MLPPHGSFHVDQLVEISCLQNLPDARSAINDVNFSIFPPALSRNIKIIPRAELSMYSSLDISRTYFETGSGLPW